MTLWLHMDRFPKLSSQEGQQDINGKMRFSATLHQSLPQQLWPNRVLNWDIFPEELRFFFMIIHLQLLLVGGLVAIFYFPIYWGIINWLIFFRGVAQPPTRLAVRWKLVSLVGLASGQSPAVSGATQRLRRRRHSGGLASGGSHEISPASRDAVPRLVQGCSKG